MSGQDKHRPDPYANIRSWDDGYRPAGLPKPPISSGPRDPPPTARPRSPRTGYPRPRSPWSTTDNFSRSHGTGCRDRDARYAGVSANVRHNGSRPDSLNATRHPRRRTFSPPPSPQPYRRQGSPLPSRHGGTRTRSRRPNQDRDRRRPVSYRAPSASLPGVHHRSDELSDRNPHVDHGLDDDIKREKHGHPSTRRAGPSSSSPEGSKRDLVGQAKKTSTGKKGLSPRWQKAAIAAFQAGGIAAMNARSQSGAWKGEKGARVATAALGAAALNAFGKGDEGKESAPKDGKAGKVKEAENLGGAIGGMLAERLASKSGNGRRGERDRDRNSHRDTGLW